ncbi:alpha/beta fold hydrolase [Cumulibacter manganitolerans]|uniref:alpha/beta fold hydrolase n=1 Tax=Cumulibacter manganitolerans TaxID=1884992 RepID=UPI001297EA9B|nr:alpha/beta hydrolase [Cumulibacter manganitolerans]
MKPDLHLSANGIDFACLERGTGPLALVLHGFPDTPVSFIPLLEALADAGYRAVAPWLRGYAPTSVPADDDYSLETLADDVSALRAELGGGPDSVIVGHDWGASVAYAAARRRGEWAKAVVMSVPPPPYLGQLLMTPAQLKRSYYMWVFQLAIAEKVVTSHDYAFVETLWREWSPGFDPTSALAEVRRALGSDANVRAAVGYYRAAFAGMRLGAAAPAVSPVPPQRPEQPVLYLHGVNDGCIAIDQDMLDRIGGALGPGSAAEWVEDAGHFVVNEHPEAVSKRIVEFLGSV